MCLRFYCIYSILRQWIKLFRSIFQLWIVRIEDKNEICGKVIELDKLLMKFFLQLLPYVQTYSTIAKCDM